MGDGNSAAILATASGDTNVATAATVVGDRNAGVLASAQGVRNVATAATVVGQ
ncbi:hypothetical protein I546_7341 [Mycobacterium kansasii 732]|nr:hypothetical protein I546_7341 [Mycobacterium kansasii 732]